MRVPLPCRFGDLAECKGKLLPLCGVSWFQWMKGMEFTYFFKRNIIWHEMDFYTTFDEEQPYGFTVSDELLSDGLVKERGYPLKGRGHASGIYYENEKIYMEFILTSLYHFPVKVQCDDDGKYVKGGDIILPPNWNTEEKRKKILYKNSFNRQTMM